MQELNSTYEALQQSRLACEERDYLIATHERSEAALAGHAGSLTSELQQAADNMARLFDRQALQNSVCYGSLLGKMAGHSGRLSQAISLLPLPACLNLAKSTVKTCLCKYLLKRNHQFDYEYRRPNDEEGQGRVRMLLHGQGLS